MKTNILIILLVLSILAFAPAIVEAQFFGSFFKKVSGVISPVITSDSIDFGSSTYVEIPNGTGNTVDAAGKIAHDTNANQLIYGNEQVLSAEFDKSFNIGTTTLASGDYGTWSSGSTSTLVVWEPSNPITVTEWRCTAAAGEVYIQWGDGTNKTATLTCGTGGSSDTSPSNNSFTAGENLTFEVGYGTDAFTNVAVSFQYTFDRQ